MEEKITAEDALKVLQEEERKEIEKFQADLNEVLNKHPKYTLQVQHNIQIVRKT